MHELPALSLQQTSAPTQSSGPSQRNVLPEQMLATALTQVPSQQTDPHIEPGHAITLGDASGDASTADGGGVSTLASETPSRLASPGTPAGGTFASNVQLAIDELAIVRSRARHMAPVSGQDVRTSSGQKWTVDREGHK